MAVRHVSVSTHDVLRAETIHAFWAERLMALGREERDGSTPQIASDLSAEAFRLVSARARQQSARTTHVHHCFAEGRVLAEELLAKEKARLRAEERDRAATSIQKQARGRNRRRAMRDAAAGKKSKKDKKGKKKKKKGKKRRRSRLAAARHLLFTMAARLDQPLADDDVGRRRHLLRRGRRDVVQGPP